MCGSTESSPGTTPCSTKSTPTGSGTPRKWFRREDQLGRELGKGSLWGRVQPENWSMDSAVLKSSADFRTGKL
jgi:hypothetical protein